MTFIERYIKSRKTKNKRQVLQKMLDDRKIPFKVEYRWGYKAGWYLCEGKGFDQRLGYDFFSAQDMINSGTLDFWINGACCSGSA